jgi:hypothetical protein
MVSRTLCAAAVAVAGMAGASGALQAEAGMMVGDGLRQAIVGRTVYLSTPVGTLPITYRANGTMSGNGRNVTALTGSDRDSGTWWIAANKLCQRWDTWLGGKTYCVTLRREGATLIWAGSDGHSGTATISR